MTKQRSWIHDNRPLGELAHWKHLFEMEEQQPGCVQLVLDIAKAQPTSFQWYRDGWRGRVMALAGWEAEGKLRTQEAYDTLYNLAFSYCYDPEGGA